jgi:hypothetical protein
LSGIAAARLCLITGRFAEAREHVTQGWAVRGEAKPYIVARLLWFQLALEMLDAYSRGRESAPSSSPLTVERNSPTHVGGYEILGRLKTALQNDSAFMEWTMQPVLDHLKSWLSEPDHALLTAFVAALSDRAKLPELNQFPEWGNATPQPLD